MKCGVVLFLFFIEILFAQSYLWPTDASQLMTSSFGEYRTGHFHAGLDIKTWNQEGFRVLAIEAGSVIRVLVSPYGYGRAVYLRLGNGFTVIYAHLSRFAPFVEKVVQEEQRQKGRFSIQLDFKPGFLPIKRGTLIGYTGSSGVGVPHLHFEVRDPENQPFNPLMLGYSVEDKQPPTLQYLSVSPLSYGSHVNGDFLPRRFSLHRVREGVYCVHEKIVGWGRIGFALSAYDQAEGASNRFAIYRLRFVLDGRSIFVVRYDCFPYEKTEQINLDRDYRLKRWGWGLFQKLYREPGNTLPFYEPDFKEGGVLCCWNEADVGRDGRLYWSRDPNRIPCPVFLGRGNHTFRIEVMDFFGNLSEVSGQLQMDPLSDAGFFSASGVNIEKERVSGTRGRKLKIQKHIFDEYIRFSVRTSDPLREPPHLKVSLEEGRGETIPLFTKGSQEFIGFMVLHESVDGPIILEVSCVSEGGEEIYLEDSLKVTMIKPEKGGKWIVSEGRVQVLFPEKAVYRPLWGGIQKWEIHENRCVYNLAYRLFPDDIPLSDPVQICVDVSFYPDPVEKLAIYGQNEKGKFVFLGNRLKGGNLFGWATDLDPFAVLLDTIPPEVFKIFPCEGTRLKEDMPCIVVGFRDDLSGIFGEDNYQLWLDGKRCIVEYDPEKDLGFYAVETPLEYGKHNLDILIRDRVGNTTCRRSHFIIDPHNKEFP